MDNTYLKNLSVMNFRRSKIYFRVAMPAYAALLDMGSENEIDLTSLTISD